MIWPVPVLGQLSIFSMIDSLLSLLWASSTSTNTARMFLSMSPCCLISLKNATVSTDDFSSQLLITQDLVKFYLPSKVLSTPLFKVISCPVLTMSILSRLFVFNSCSRFSTFKIISVFCLLNYNILHVVLSCLLSYPQYLKLFLVILLLNKYQLNEWTSVFINIGCMHLYYIFIKQSQSTAFEIIWILSKKEDPEQVPSQTEGYPSSWGESGTLGFGACF